MAAMGTKEVNRDEIIAQMPEVVARSFILGNAAECADQLRSIGDRVPINPVITRGNWPGMSVDDMVDYLDELGRELIPSLRDYQPTDTLAVPETTD